MGEIPPELRRGMEIVREAAKNPADRRWARKPTRG